MGSHVTGDVTFNTETYFWVVMTSLLKIRIESKAQKTTNFVQRVMQFALTFFYRAHF